MEDPTKPCDIKFRHYSQGDEGQIIELLKGNWSYLQSPDALKFWRWLYRSGPSGGALIVLADHNGKVVGHYAMFPMHMRFGQQLVMGAKAEGSVVHEEYRGNIAQRFCPDRKEFRVFGELITRLWTDAAARGTALIWGFPNAPALKTQVRAGYSHITVDTIDLVRPKDVRSTAEIYYSSGRLSPVVRGLLVSLARAYCRVRMALRRPKAAPVDEGVVLRRIGPDDLGERLKRFIDRYGLENDQITVHRDAEYVRWRFLENPVTPHRVYVAEREGELAGLVAVSVSCRGPRRHACIVDIVGLNGLERDLGALLDFAIHDVDSEGIACVRTWLSDCERSRRYAHILRRAGFFTLPTGLRGPHVDLIYKLLDGKLSDDIASDPERWYITMAFTEGTS